MPNYSLVLELLEQKRTLFLKAEQVSEAMFSMEVEALEEAMEERTRLFQEVDRLDMEIQEHLKQDAKAIAAVRSTCDRQALPPDLAQLYDASLGVKAVVNRMLQNAEALQMHLHDEQQRIAKKMEEINQSGSAVAEQYYNSTQTGRSFRAVPSIQKSI